MLQNRINEMVKEAQRAQRQESSTSVSTPPSGADVDEQLLGAVGGVGVDPVGVVDGMPAQGALGFPLELLEGASVSGESGVFTQTSAESKYINHSSLLIVTRIHNFAFNFGMHIAAL